MRPSLLHAILATLPEAATGSIRRGDVPDIDLAASATAGRLICCCPGRVAAGVGLILYEPLHTA